MAYEKQTWQSNELLTSEKLNHMEDGIAEAKTIQTAVNDPTASGTAIAFIDSIEQNAQGVITPTKKTVTTVTTATDGLMLAADKTKLDGIQTGAQVNPGNATTSAAGLMSASDKTKLDGIDDAIEKREVLIKELSIQADNLPQTFRNQTGVETDMVCIKAEFGTPSAQLGDWDVNTNTAGQIVISGSKAANVTTTLKLYLMKSR